MDRHGNMFDIFLITEYDVFITSSLFSLYLIDKGNMTRVAKQKTFVFSRIN